MRAGAWLIFRSCSHNDLHISRLCKGFEGLEETCPLWRCSFTQANPYEHRTELCPTCREAGKKVNDASIVKLDEGKAAPDKQISRRIDVQEARDFAAFLANKARRAARLVGSEKGMGARMQQNGRDADEQRRDGGSEIGGGSGCIGGKSRAIPFRGNNA